MRVSAIKLIAVLVSAAVIGKIVVNIPKDVLRYPNASGSCSSAVIDIQNFPERLCVNAVV